MNQNFSFSRFNLLVLKHWADNKKRYSLSILAYFGLLIGWFLFIFLISEGTFLPDEVQFATFFLTLFAVGTFYASQYYSDLGSREKGSHFLLVPASTFEKYLCSLLYTVILFPLFFISVFYTADFLMVTLGNALASPVAPYGKSMVANIFTVDLISLTPEVSINLLLFFFSIQAVFLLGSVYFKKYSFIKTIITGIVCCLIFFSLVFIIQAQVASDWENDQLWIPHAVRLLFYIIAPLSWIMTYFVLKAKQV